MFNFRVLVALGCMLSASAVAQAVPTLQFIYLTVSPNTYDVYARVTGTAGDLNATEGLSSYSLFVKYQPVAGNAGKNDQVAWTQNNLKATASNVDQTKGFWRPLDPNTPGDTVARPIIANIGQYERNIANTQFDSFDPIEGIGKFAVSVTADTGPNVNLGAIARLGRLAVNGGGVLNTDYTLVSDGGLFATGGSGAIRAALDPTLGQMNVTQLVTRLGDANIDGVVDGLDIPVFLTQLSGSPSTGFVDMNGDGVVDGLDIPLFLSALGGGTSTAVVPEPAAACFALAGGVMLLAGRRRR